MKNLLDKFARLANSKPFKKGFTLTELLVVVLVIAVLGAIALPSYTKAVRKSRVSDALNNMNMVSLKQQDYLLNNEKYASKFKDLNVPIAGLNADGAVSTVGKFDYTLNKACVYASSNIKNEGYQLLKNVETQNIGCLPSGEIDLCAMVSDLVPTVGSPDAVDCEFVAGTEPGGPPIVPPPPPPPPAPIDCGACTKPCWDGSTLTGTCNETTGVCDYTGLACPEEPVAECKPSDGNKVVDNCIFTCNVNKWEYSAPSEGYAYDPALKTCYKNACPDGTVQKQTIDDVHYCKTYTMGKWVPEDWSQPCKD